MYVISALAVQHSFWLTSILPSSEILNIDEIPAELLDGLEARCRQLFFNTRLGTMCRPEFLSKGDGLARTFEEVEKTTIDSWNLAAAHFREVGHFTSLASLGRSC